jgi:hypothetical protein
MNPIRYLVFVLICILLISCNGSRKLLREAKAFEEGGMKKEAFARYEQLDHQYSKPEGKLGMRRIAQSELDAKYAKARMLCMSGNFEAAFTAFDEAYSDYSRRKDLELTLPADGEMQRDACKRDFVESLYKEAEKLAIDGQYELAKEAISKLLRYDPNNAKAGYLEILCDILPNYNAGVKAFELGLYEDAYRYLNEVTKLDAGYKDALQLRDQALKKAQFTLAFIPINESNHNDLQLKISAAVKQAILDLNNPMIRLVDRDDLNPLIQEQSKSMTALFDDKTAIEAGKLLGARYLITGRLVGYNYNGPKTRQIEKKGYLGPNTSSGKIKYTEFSESSSLSASFKFQIVDSETGEVYASGMIPFASDDGVVRAWFGGNAEKVYPGNWNYLLVTSKQDQVDLSGYDALQKKFKESKSAKNEMEFHQDLSAAVAKAIAKNINDFHPKR